MKRDLVRTQLRTVAIVGAMLAGCGAKATPETAHQPPDRIEPAAPAASTSDREREAAIKGAEQTTAAHEQQDRKAAADKQSAADKAAQQKAAADKAAADKAAADKAAADKAKKPQAH